RLLAFDRHGNRAATRNRAQADDDQIQEQLDLVLRQEKPGPGPGKFSLAVGDNGARNLLRITGIDLGSSRTRSTEGETRKLQACGCLLRTLAHEIEGDLAH